MFCLARPTDLAIQEFLNAQRRERLSYPEQRITQWAAAGRYTVDHHRAKIAEGTGAWDRAKQAVSEWKMFETGWTFLCWPDEPIKIETTVAVVASHYGFWSINASRIVYVIDEREDSPRYGFGYGTLRGHAEIGEERFTVEYHPRDASVWYDVYALSRPGAMARLGYPLARRLQKRFATDSIAAMRRSVDQTRKTAS